MSARQAVACLLVVAFWLSNETQFHCSDTLAASGGSIAIEVADLQDQLESGLRARLPAEFAFIRRVVNLVETDRLPLDLVVSTFQWARRHKRYPFPYFERALRTRAARLGIAI